MIGRLRNTVLLAVLSICPARAGTVLFGSAHTGFGGDYFDVSQIINFPIGPGSSIGGFGPFGLLEASCPAIDGGPPAWLCTAPGSYSYSDSIVPTDGVWIGSNPDEVTHHCGACTGVTFTGVLTLPDFGPSPPQSLIMTIPVSVSGGGPPFSFSNVPGIATIRLVEAFSPGRYVFSSADYLINPAPEPAAMSLTGLGVAGIGIVAGIRTLRRRLTAREVRK